MPLEDSGLEAGEWPVLFHAGETLGWSVNVDGQVDMN